MIPREWLCVIETFLGRTGLFSLLLQEVPFSDVAGPFAEEAAFHLRWDPGSLQLSYKLGKEVNSWAIWKDFTWGPSEPGRDLVQYKALSNEDTLGPSAAKKNIQAGLGLASAAFVAPCAWQRPPRKPAPHRLYSVLPG